MAWIDIPNNFRDSLIAVLEWYLKELPKLPLPEGEEHLRLKRLLEDLYQGKLYIYRGAIFFLKQAMSEALQGNSNVGVDNNTLTEIQDWLNTSS